MIAMDKLIVEPYAGIVTDKMEAQRLRLGGHELFAQRVVVTDSVPSTQILTLSGVAVEAGRTINIILCSEVYQFVYDPTLQFRVDGTTVATRTYRFPNDTQTVDFYIPAYPNPVSVVLGGCEYLFDMFTHANYRKGDTPFLGAAYTPTHIFAGCESANGRGSIYVNGQYYSDFNVEQHLVYGGSFRYQIMQPYTPTTTGVVDISVFGLAIGRYAALRVRQ